jgi:hypothetical protein
MYVVNFFKTIYISVHLNKKPSDYQMANCLLIYKIIWWNIAAFLSYLSGLIIIRSD